MSVVAFGHNSPVYQNSLVQMWESYQTWKQLGSNNGVVGDMEDKRH